MTISHHTENYIRGLATHLAPGQSTKSICPFCEADHERSFDVRRRADRPHRLTFRCYRGKCAVSGSVLDRAGASMYLTIDPEEPLNAGAPVATQHPDLPGPMMTSRLQSRYNISWQMIRQHQLRQKDDMTLCMPWLDETGGQRGWIEKRYAGAYKSYTDCWDWSKVGRLAFPRIDQSYGTLKRNPQAFVVLVEDLLSAYRIARLADEEMIHAYPVALIGADVSTFDVARVDRLFSKGILCLDPDQWPIGTLRVLNRFKPYAIDLRGHTCPQDPKDMAEEPLRELIISWDEELND
jgi:hypothetical protein